MKQIYRLEKGAMTTNDSSEAMEAMELQVVVA
jgi:hypothetical protein